MKHLFFGFLIALSLVACSDEHSEHGHKEEAHGHGDDAQSFSGATHKEGKGITLLPETKERLGVKVDEVTSTNLREEFAFTAKVYARDPGGNFEAAGTISSAKAASLRVGTKVQVNSSNDVSLEGTVIEAAPSIATGESDVIVRFTVPDKSMLLGSFVQVKASLENNEEVTAVPKDAVIKGTTESFVYVVNGDAYLRTVVKPGRETSDAVEIKDGLLEGDSVVSKGAMDLWLVELRAVKGGQGCCPAPPAKGKGK